MNKHMPKLGWGLVALALSGTASASPGGHEHHEAAHSAATTAEHADHAAAHEHQHGLLEVDDAVPSLAVALMPDASSGWNVHLQVRNFAFAPALANGPHRPGTGHAHIYVDGQKQARVYAPWFHLPALGPGPHEIRVVLNSNDHREYAHQGHPVEQVLLIEER